MDAAGNNSASSPAPVLGFSSDLAAFVLALALSCLVVIALQSVFRFVFFYGMSMRQLDQAFGSVPMSRFQEKQPGSNNRG
jgi:hypothetical protein